MDLTETDRAFLQRRSERKRVGLLILPALLAGTVLLWGGFFVAWPVSINPFHAIGYFEGRALEPGTVTTYAVITASLVNLVFALVCALIVLAIAFSRHERRYQKLLSPPEEAPKQPSAPASIVQG